VRTELEIPSGPAGTRRREAYARYEMLMTRHAHVAGLAALLGALGCTHLVGCGGQTQGVTGRPDGDVRRDAAQRDAGRDAGHDANCPTSCPPSDCDAGCTNGVWTQCLPLSPGGTSDCPLQCASTEVVQQVCPNGCAKSGWGCDTSPADDAGRHVKHDAGHDAGCPTSCPPWDCDAGCAGITMTLCLPLSPPGNPNCPFECGGVEVAHYVCYYGCVQGSQACNTRPADGGPDAPYLHDAAVGSDCLAAYCGP